MTEIPNGWNRVTLNNLGNWVTGSTPQSKDPLNFGDEVEFVTPSDIGYGGRLGVVERRISELGASRVRKLKAPSVNLVCIGTIGKVALANREVTTNQQINSLEPNESVVLPNFAMWLLSSPKIQEALWQASSSTTVAILNKGNLCKIETSIPPLPEQHKIVEILEDHLSRLDAALADVKQAKVKAAQFRRSLLQAAFTGNLGSDGTRFMTQIPNGWRTKTLKDWGMDAQSGFASGAHNSENKGIIHLRPMNISRLGKLDFESYKSVEDDSHRRIVKGDILFNNTNSAELVGKTTLIDIDGEFAYSNHMTRLRFPVEEVAHKYMSILLHSLWMSGYFNEICSNHVNQASVSIKRLEQVEVSLPPLPEQHRIVEILEDHLSRLDASIALADAMEKQSAGLRRSLLQAAFTGQLTKEVASV